MNFAAIKFVYLCLVDPLSQAEFTFFGGNRFKISWFLSNGEKYAEITFKNEFVHGRWTVWDFGCKTTGLIVSVVIRACPRIKADTL